MRSRMSAKTYICRWQSCRWANATLHTILARLHRRVMHGLQYQLAPGHPSPEEEDHLGASDGDRVWEVQLQRSAGLHGWPCKHSTRAQISFFRVSEACHQHLVRTKPERNVKPARLQRCSCLHHGKDGQWSPIRTRSWRGARQKEREQPRPAGRQGGEEPNERPSQNHFLRFLFGFIRDSTSKFFQDVHWQMQNVSHPK